MIVTKNKPKILICDDDQNLHLAIKTALQPDFEVKSAYNSDEALLIVRKNHFDLVLLDMEMEHEKSGLELIPKILATQENIRIIVFSGNQNFTMVKNALLAGASDYILKDAGTDELKHVLAKTFQHQKLAQKNQQNQFELKKQHSSHLMIGESAAIQKIKKQIEKAKNSAAPIIIFGETGTGKEVIARSLRRTLADQTIEPFIAVDSGTIQSSVAESTLFGYEKGAFTGAEKTTRGLFEEANGGTIYFDELANMPLEIQNKLLRVVQEKEVLRIGSTKPISLEFRIIGSTNQDLEALVREGKFKEDLFQRLCVLQVDVPPLRERTDDIPLLIEHFSKIHQGSQARLSFLPETIEVLKNYPWSGNVREVSNLILYLYTMMEGDAVSPLDLPPKILKNSSVAKTTKFSPTATQGTSGDGARQGIKKFYAAVEEFEQKYLQEQYALCEGNISKMAVTLEMDRSYLHGKLKGFGIHAAKK